MINKLKLFLCILPISLYIPVFAQSDLTRIQGTIRDFHNEEPLPFVSIYWQKAGWGVSSDSIGNFSLKYSSIIDDSLVVSGVGYKLFYLPISMLDNNKIGNIFLKIAPVVKEVVVKAKYNRGVWFWKKIMAKKINNNPENLTNYYCEQYGKFELDLVNINADKFKKNIVTKPFSFILNNIDSISERKPFLPVYLTETFSDFYYQKNPFKTYEYIKEIYEKGFENRSILKELGGTYQQINPYSELINIFQHQFIGILHHNAPDFYRFKIGDTIYIGGRRTIRFSFNNRLVGSSTFDGEAWIDDETMAIQKITLRPTEHANLNFINGLSIVQEFKHFDSIWFLTREKFVTDFSPIGNNNLSFKIRKTLINQKIRFNDTNDLKIVSNQKKEQTINIGKVNNNLDSFNTLSTRRPEELQNTEKMVLTLIDTLFKNKTFHFYKNTLEVLASGIYDFKYIYIGPWYNWLSGNIHEGVKLRFDIGTNIDFSRKWNFNFYTAYGLKDQKFKGGFTLRHQFSRSPWHYLLVYYQNDITSRSNNQGFGVNNIFGSLARNNAVPIKLQYLEEQRLEYSNETHYGLSVKLTLDNYKYTPLLNLPNKDFYNSFSNNPFNSFQTSITLRLARKERYLERNFTRYRIPSRHPVYTFTYTKSWKNILQSTNNFQQFYASVSAQNVLPKFGQISYLVQGTYLVGKTSYPYLNFLTGNEVFYYNNLAFNLLNQYEFVSDRNLSVFFEHNILNSLFTLMPFSRKWKIRQFWNLRGVIGNLSKENAALNLNFDHFNSLNGKWYLECGTGFDNIFKYFRLDFIWKILQPGVPVSFDERKFGILFSFRFSL